METTLGGFFPRDLSGHEMASNHSQYTDTSSNRKTGSETGHTLTNK